MDTQRSPHGDVADLTIRALRGDLDYSQIASVCLAGIINRFANDLLANPGTIDLNEPTSWFRIVVGLCSEAPGVSECLVWRGLLPRIHAL